MSARLELAWRGWGRVQPNPLVGAVVLAGGELVGEGWHAEFGERARRADRARGGRASGRAGRRWSCTLEPCAHQGKQPPCTEAILARRASGGWWPRSPDPNPVAAGGAARLRAAGVEVELGPRAATRPRPRTPSSSIGCSDRVAPVRRAQARHQLDGRIADADGRSRWISGADGARLRALASGRVRRDRGRRTHRAGRRSPAHRARGRSARESRRAGSSSTPAADLPGLAQSGPQRVGSPHLRRRLTAGAGHAGSRALERARRARACGAAA